MDHFNPDDLIVCAPAHVVSRWLRDVKQRGKVTAKAGQETSTGFISHHCSGRGQQTCSPTHPPDHHYPNLRYNPPSLVLHLTHCRCVTCIYVFHVQQSLPAFCTGHPATIHLGTAASSPQPASAFCSPRSADLLASSPHPASAFCSPACRPHLPHNHDHAPAHGTT
jgi:hypothetical protein